MKVYLFYKSIPDLEPVLYGFSSDKLRAAIFKLYRPKLAQVVKDISKKEYNEMRDSLKGKEIIPHEFETASDHFGKMKVAQIATEDEVINIILHKDELVLRELSKHTLPLELFRPEVRKYLKELDMHIVNRYGEQVQIYPGDYEELPKLSFRVDELGLFVQLYGDMMNDKISSK